MGKCKTCGAALRRGVKMGEGVAVSKPSGAKVAKEVGVSKPSGLRGLTTRELKTQAAGRAMAEAVERDDVEVLRIASRDFQETLPSHVYLAMVKREAVKCIWAVRQSQTANGFTARMSLPTLASMYGGKGSIGAACRGSGCELSQLLDIIDRREDVAEDTRAEMRRATVGM